MENLEVTLVQINILTPGALFSEQAISTPKLSFDTVFLLVAYKYVSQAVFVIPPTKAETKKRQRDERKEKEKNGIIEEKRY